MSKLATRDPRLRPRQFSGRDFLLVFAVLLLLASGQAMIRPAFPEGTNTTIAYGLALFFYWAIVSAVFCLVYARQQRRVFDRPMRQLSAAADRVAGGDFTVQLLPAHQVDRWDYVDVMFDDFNTMVVQLRSIEALKDDFIADVSHEIKTPLAVIANYAAALEEAEALTPEQRIEYSQTIAQATQRLSGLVSNILKLNKLDNEHIAVAALPFDLARQLAEMALPYAELTESKGVRFNAELTDQTVIWADEGLLEIIWQNLLANAVKFTPPGGRVTLTQTATADEVTVVVRDSGCGMDEVTRQRAFDKFYQSETAAGDEGNGLGLALVRRVSQLVGATVTVSSRPGAGSTFTVRLPTGGPPSPLTA